MQLARKTADFKVKVRDKRLHIIELHKTNLSNEPPAAAEKRVQRSKMQLPARKRIARPIL